MPPVAAAHPGVARPRLTYLDIAGFADGVRLALAFLGDGDVGDSFEDVRVNYEGLVALRAAGSLPFGQVPTLELPGAPGRVFAQSGALLRWAGDAAGLYPRELLLDIEQVLGALGDIRSALLPRWYANALPRNPADGTLFAASALTPAQVAGVASALDSVLLPMRLAQLDAAVARSAAAAAGRNEDGPYVCGERLTIADLELHGVVRGLQDGSYCEGVPPALIDGAPRLVAIADAVAAHPRVAAYRRREAVERAERTAAAAACAGAED